MNSEVIHEEEVLEELSDADMEEILDQLLEEAEEEGIEPDDILNYIEFSSEDEEDELVEDFIAEVFGKIKKAAGSARAKARKYMQKWLKGSAGKMYKKNQAKRRDKVKRGSVKVDKNLSKQRKKWAKVYSSFEPEEGEELMEDEILDISEDLDEASIDLLIENELIDEDGFLDPILDNLFDDDGDVLTEHVIDFINEYNEQLTEEDGEEAITVEEAEELHEVLKKIGSGIKKAGKHVWKHKKKYAAGAALAAGAVAAGKNIKKRADAEFKAGDTGANAVQSNQARNAEGDVKKEAQAGVKARKRAAIRKGASDLGTAIRTSVGTREGRAGLLDKAETKGSEAASAISKKAGEVRDAAGRKAEAIRKGASATQAVRRGMVTSTEKKGLRTRAGGILRGLAASFDAETLNVDGHMEAMFEGEEFSQDFIDRASTIFKAAVGQEIQVQLQEIDEQVEEHVETVEEQLAEEMTANVDKYLNYVTEQWMEDNQVAVEQQLRTELAEDFIVGLKGLFDAHYIDVPESKVDLVDALQEKVEMLEDKLNEAVNENIKLSDGMDTFSKETVIDKLSQDLSLEETKKFKELAQSVEVNGELVEKMQTLKESYFGPTAAHSEDNEPMEQLAEGSMAAYAAVLDRTLSN